MPISPPLFVKTHLCSRSPALEALWQQPSEQQLNQLAKQHNCQVRFSSHLKAHSAQEYEQLIFDQQLVPTRIDEWHDLLNAAMWMLWPLSKQALNRAHVEELNPAHTSHLPTEDDRPSNPQRNRRRDALTLLDEAGVVVISSQPEIETLNRHHQWDELFWQRRADWFDSIQPLLIGHGLAEQCLQPYLGLTGKAIHLQTDGWDQCPLDGSASVPELAALADTKLSERIGLMRDPAALCPLPVLGIPGWHADNDCAAFYRNRDYFRPRSK